MKGNTILKDTKTGQRVYHSMMTRVRLTSETHNHERGLESMTLEGDAPAVAAAMNALMDDEAMGHPNETKILVRTGMGSHFVRAYAHPDVRGLSVRTKDAHRFGEDLLRHLGMEIHDEDG